MRLSDFFRTSSSQAGEMQEIARTEGVSTEKLNRQIKALTPGSQLQGEVVGHNGSEVQIKLSDDMVLTARLEQDVNVEEGQILTFEVRNNGSTLSLRPLFTNTATADNVYKALQMANLPINNTTVEMTETMMQQGMSVDARSLQNMFREVMSNAQAPAAHVVQLHQLGLPVDEANLHQMESYKALTHQLVRGMTDVLAELPEAFAQLQETAGQEKAVQVYQNVLLTLLEDTQTGEGVEGLQTGEGAEALPQNPEVVSATVSLPETALAEEAAEPAEHISATASPLPDMTEGREIPFGTLSQPETRNFLRLLSAIPQESYPEIVKLIQGIGQGTVKPEEALHRLAKMPAGKTAGIGEALTDIFQSREFQKLLEMAVLKQWSLKPEQVVENREVKEVYERLLKQLDGVREALQEGGTGHTAAMKSAVNLSQNIDFMNQMNQLYAYVQLPLRMNGGHKNGELYVYTNKRSLAKEEGSVSAFLHLDMENLGPVDVYVTLQRERVNTRFTVADDAMLEFLNDHMHILNERLAKKGYAMKCEMTVREAGKEEASPIDRILQTNQNMSLLAQYAFDVRA